MKYDGIDAANDIDSFCRYGGSNIHIIYSLHCSVCEAGRQKKRYDYFMGSNRRPTHNLEMKIEEYFETSKKIESQYSKLLDMVTDMDKTDKSKIQKVGLIRYNPLMKWAASLFCFGTFGWE